MAIGLLHEEVKLSGDFSYLLVVLSIILFSH
jgi:hypothetical protein